MCPVPFPEKADAAQQSPVGYPARGKEDLITRSQIAGGINPIRILNTHPGHSFSQFRCIHNQAGHNFAMEAAHRGSGNNPFGSAPDSHHGMHPISPNGNGNPGRQIAVADQADSCSRPADIFHELRVPRPVQHDHR